MYSPTRVGYYLSYPYLIYVYFNVKMKSTVLLYIETQHGITTRVTRFTSN